ncbi:MAG: sensor histidine kinase, partial [Paucibacter sp.]|nr:sensor histidine kinase [Roseateles sp.]
LSSNAQGTSLILSVPLEEGAAARLTDDESMAREHDPSAWDSE